MTPDPKIKPSAPIKVARISYRGISDPEPGGWRRLAAVMHNASQGELALETVDPESAKLDGFHVAHLTGTVAFTLAPAAREEIKRFVGAGGTLVVDAAGGSSGFTTSAETELGAMFGEEAKHLDEPLTPSHAIYSTGGKPAEIGYRSFARNKPGIVNVPQLRGITRDGRVAVVYSREDLSVGLVGQPIDGIIGYDPPTATTLMSNVLMYASAHKSAPATPATR